MDYIWNIYEPLDPQDLQDDPFDVFVYAQRMTDIPHQGDLVYLEGRNHRVIACRLDHNLTESQVQQNVVYYKVCIL